MNRRAPLADLLGDLLAPLIIVAIVGLPLAGWLTHLFVCFRGQLWGFLIAGAIFFPIGVLHGWGVWLGLW